MGVSTGTVELGERLDTLAGESLGTLLYLELPVASLLPRVRFLQSQAVSTATLAKPWRHASGSPPPGSTCSTCGAGRPVQPPPHRHTAAAAREGALLLRLPCDSSAGALSRPAAAAVADVAGLSQQSLRPLPRGSAVSAAAPWLPRMMASDQRVGAEELLRWHSRAPRRHVAARGGGCLGP